MYNKLKNNRLDIQFKYAIDNVSETKTLYNLNI